MFENIMEIIKKAGVFLVLAQTILHLCVSEVYEKYVKMIVVLVTAVLMILPVLEFIQEGKMQAFEDYRSEYEKKSFGEDIDFEKIRDDGWEEYYQEYIGTDG